MASVVIVSLAEIFLGEEESHLFSFWGSKVASQTVSPCKILLFPLGVQLMSKGRMWQLLLLASQLQVSEWGFSFFTQISNFYPNYSPAYFPLDTAYSLMQKSQPEDVLLRNWGKLSSVGLGWRRPKKWWEESFRMQSEVGVDRKIMHYDQSHT